MKKIFIKRKDLSHRYKFKCFCGQGNTGTVGKYRDLITRKIVAIKKVSLENIDNEWYQEKEILEQLSDIYPAFLKYYNSFESKNHLYIIMEYAKGPDLNTVIHKSRLSEKRAQFIFFQLVSAISIAHKRKIVHRDLKLQHIILCKKDYIKILDWGYAVFSDKVCTTTAGSPYYASPEILSDKPILNTSNDVWALGVILYSMLTGKMLFKERNTLMIYDRIVNFDYDLSDKNIPDKAKNLLEQILVPYKKRITCEDILEHLWLTENLL